MVRIFLKQVKAHGERDVFSQIKGARTGGAQHSPEGGRGNKGDGGAVNSRYI